MKRHLPFIAMTIAAFLLLFTAISRGSEPVWMDAAPDATPDVVVFADPIPTVKEVIVSAVVTPSKQSAAQPDCRDGFCRVARRSDADTSNNVATSDTGTRPFRSRRGLFRRMFSR